ncbi:hypothetical protein, partial [Lactiplantibacillus plantarum]|uniref:hypothetical protein n=1 Tax=Lactiplantibacillus plantarum TaxID=1590 RepID=UPI003EC7C127
SGQGRVRLGRMPVWIAATICSGVHLQMPVSLSGVTLKSGKDTETNIRAAEKSLHVGFSKKQADV